MTVTGPACTFTESRRCDPGRDCVEAGDFGTWTILDEAAGVYHNCGPGPVPGSCLTSRAHFGRAGAQILVQDVDFPLSLAVSPEGEATEVVANGNIAFVRWGRCTRAPLPAGLERRR